MPTTDQHDAAVALVARFPVQLHAHDRRRRTALGIEVAGLIAAGWPERDLILIATHDLPVRINNPARFVRSRFEGRTPPVHRAGAPAEQAWRQAEPDPGRILVGAAAARAALRGAS